MRGKKKHSIFFVSYLPFWYRRNGPLRFLKEKNYASSKTCLFSRHIRPSFFEIAEILGELVEKDSNSRDGKTLILLQTRNRQQITRLIRIRENFLSPADFELWRVFCNLANKRLTLTGEMTSRKTQIF
jgi:hypothetical protein